MNIEIRSGDIFGLWTVKSKAANKKGRTAWLAKCRCGTERIVLSQALKDGTSRSCGCQARIGLAAGNVTHGMTDTPEYAIWRAMLQRCLNPNSRFFSHYGGRGISACEDWRKFENFYLDMGDRPDGHELDRINNNGNYEPGNCRWATRKEQCRNQRRNHRIEFGNKTWCLTDLAEHLRMNKNTLLKRLRSGWSVEKATRTPVVKVNTPS